MIGIRLLGHVANHTAVRRQKHDGDAGMTSMMRPSSTDAAGIDRKGGVEGMLKEAVANHRAGRLHAAAALYASILARDDRHPDALHLLGVVAFQQRRYAESADLITRAIRQDPGQAAFYNNLGNTYHAMGERERALACFRRAVAIDSRMADAQFNLANAYRRAGDVDGAIRHYRCAATADPANARVFNNLGIAYAAKGMVEEALDAYRSAIRIDPQGIDAYHHLCTLQEGTARLEDALQTARAALRVDPASAQAHLNLAQIHYRRGEYRAAVEVLQPLVANGRSSDLYARANYLLGKVQHRLNRYDAAFDAFSRANRHLLASVALAAYRRDAAGASTMIRNYEAFFTAERAARWRSAAQPPADPAPAFLVGFPRSGTTLLEQVLHAHSEVATVDERPVFDTVFRPFLESVDGLHRLDHLSPDDIARLRHRYFHGVQQQCRTVEPVSLTVDKLPLNILYLGLIYRIFPTAKIIVALRHPLGCILSCFMQEFKMNRMMFNFLTLEGSARFYASVMNLYLHYRRILPLDIHHIRYEDAVADFEAEMRRLFAFLALKWERRVLAYHDRAKARIIHTPSYSQVVKPIYMDAVDRWKTYATHLSPALPWVAPFIRHFGYAHGEDA